MDVGGFGQWKGRNFPKGKNSTGTGKGKRTGKDGKMVRNHQDERTHRKPKVSVGIAGKQVTNTRTAG